MSCRVTAPGGDGIAHRCLVEIPSARSKKALLDYTGIVFRSTTTCPTGYTLLHTLGFYEVMLSQWVLNCVFDRFVRSGLSCEWTGCWVCACECGRSEPGSASRGLRTMP